MLANYHTHTTFCDGKNSAEEVVLSAIERGFDIIGFSGHGYTPFDTSYCIKDMPAYASEIKRLKEKYSSKIKVLLGIEEDAFGYVNRADFEYIIGSSHYVFVADKYYPIDSNAACLKNCIDAFGGEVLLFAKEYYETFCSYIKVRKPDIVGHFDLITKFDEMGESLFFSNSEYLKLSEKYMDIAAENDVIFEINTGAIARGVRTSPYLYENLLYALKKKDAKIILSSDSHSAETLDFAFDEMKNMLRDIGFEYACALTEDGIEKYRI